jgi:2',3'-cyclic-nucleotide 2'-phosphodiesterase/3'-nucleotidase
MRIVFSLSACLLAGCAALPQGTPIGSRATLALLETTDLHSNVLSYDYYKLAPDPSLGLERTATLIRHARAEYPNNVLLDNGDTIQGTALADYQALVAPVDCRQVLGIYKAFRQLGYDGTGIGNHDFNYGLAFLSQVTGNRFDVDGVDPAKPACAAPGFPQVLANVYSIKSGKTLFKPWHIIEKRVSATGPDGKPVQATVRVGIIAFVPPTILTWDKRWLEGKVRTEGVKETAQKYLPEMRAQGADLVVAISHAGLDDSPYSPAMENGSWHLAQVPGIDAMLIGHSHQQFPNAASTIPQFKLPGVDKARGTVHGVPTVMPSLWGKQLGVIALQLAYDGKRWVVEKDRTQVAVRATQTGDKLFVDAAPDIAPLLEREHADTIRYVKTPIGTSSVRMSTYFADVGDVSAVQLVNEAQTEYMKRYVRANLPQYANLPVLSVASPFKAGSASVTDYTDVAPGPVALNNAADLYLYPNSLQGVKVNGAELKAWLEKSAERFNTIDPSSTAPQELVNTGFPGYNFDMMTSADVRYEIDVTQPPGKRIRQLEYRGAPVQAAQEFIVATNNYRASGGGNFPALDGSRTVAATPDNNRDVLIAHIQATKSLQSTIARSWRFTPVVTKGQVVFHSAPGKLALAQAAGLTTVGQLKADDGLGRGFALYAVDLSR